VQQVHSLVDKLSALVETVLSESPAHCIRVRVVARLLTSSHSPSGAVRSNKVYLPRMIPSHVASATARQ
jgi:hypothetical protein